ncbi:MAG TPA: exo-beta-N-acetylmuramidase NamZ domain-containing protein [Bryobacteraceae bacterium]|nr:exo-beta-N-acetylmuramidase NamZ domain-containing protein [Bryobacteraceae bacterium]
MKLLVTFLFVSLLSAQETFTGGPALDQVIEQAIQDGQIPGAVVVVGHDAKVVYRKAYGFRSLIPAKEPMTLDTIFDAASLTKVVATASCVLKLVELGKVRINDKVTAYLPEYQGGSSDLTVRQLLTHYSGLRPDLDLKPEWSGYETGIAKALVDKPVAAPGSRFVYSDINFILLGEIVRRASGTSLAEFSREQIFQPLGMKETMFQPPRSLAPRIAPTEVLPGTQLPLRGVVHDPTSRFMGGIAGHAGVFTTADDLAKFAEVMLGMGQRNGVRIFSPLGVRLFTTPQSPGDSPAVRGLGWDIDSPFSGNRGDLFPIGSYGHTGFTGTSMWMDPYTNSYVILLSNSVHPHVKAAITSLRSRVASVVAAGLNVSVPLALQSRTPRPRAASQPQNSGQVLTGLDVLAADGFASLKGKRVGLITNHTGLSREGKRGIDLMVAAGVNLKALFSPEHGIVGKEDQENVGNTKDAVSGIPVFSLYSGPNRRPSGEMLQNIDVLVFDIQDIGSRFYTYTCTMLNAMEEAAKRKVPFIVLDRPNPITGLHVEGPMLDATEKSFVGCFVMPLRHGMTIGELARMFNSGLHPAAELTVVAMKNWRRGDWFDATGLTWVDPSPNMRSLSAAILYPGIGMLEYSKEYSVGRGTDAPFEQIGADWMRGKLLADYLNNRQIAGIRVYPTRLTPTASNFAGKTIEGIRFVLTDRDAFQSTNFGLELAAALAKLFPGKMTWMANLRLVGSRAALELLEKENDPASLQSIALRGLTEFEQKRNNFLLY